MKTKSARHGAASAARFNLEPLEPRTMLTVISSPIGTWGSENISATVGQQFRGLVAKFKTSDLGALAGDVQGIFAEIHWDNETPVDFGTVEVLSNGVIKVFGQHTYQVGTASTYTGDVVVDLGLASPTRTPAARLPDEVDSKLTLTDPNYVAPPPGSIIPIIVPAAEAVFPLVPGTDLPVPSTGLFTGVVAETFYGYGGSGLDANAYALIDWGDGTIPQFGIIENAGGGANYIAGTRVYTTPGTYHVHVTAYDYRPDWGGPYELICNVLDTATFSPIQPSARPVGANATVSAAVKLDSSLTAQDLVAGSGTSATNDLLDS